MQSRKQLPYRRPSVYLYIIHSRGECNETSAARIGQGWGRGKAKRAGAVTGLAERGEPKNGTELIEERGAKGYRASAMTPRRSTQHFVSPCSGRSARRGEEGGSLPRRLSSSPSRLRTHPFLWKWVGVRVSEGKLGNLRAASRLRVLFSESPGGEAGFIAEVLFRLFNSNRPDFQDV